jgi:uncharacterized membrane protein YdjX (TVP38/TMEM64 family)
MRLLIVPAILFGITALLLWTLGERVELPESLDEVVVWLRSHGDRAWLVGGGVILADSILPMPSTPALLTLGIIYGPLLGGLIGGVASVSAGMLGFGATRLLGRRGALFLVGERDLLRTQTFYARWGLYAVAFGRALGGPAELAVVIAGLSEMSLLSVLGALCLGGFVSGFVMAGLGAVAVTQPLLATAGVVTLLGTLLLLGRGLLRAGGRSAAP